jgi:hypothetical protein
MTTDHTQKNREHLISVLALYDTSRYYDAQLKAYMELPMERLLKQYAKNFKIFTEEYSDMEAPSISEIEAHLNSKENTHLEDCSDDELVEALEERAYPQPPKPGISGVPASQYNKVMEMRSKLQLHHYSYLCKDSCDELWAFTLNEGNKPSFDSTAGIWDYQGRPEVDEEARLIQWSDLELAHPGLATFLKDLPAEESSIDLQGYFSEE